MKTRFIATGLIAATLLIAGAIAAHAQEAVDMTAMMAKMEQVKALGEPHKKFAEMAGTWSVAAKFWMDPSAPPVESNGTSEFKTILGGRYLVQNLTAEMMGEPFHGMGITAFDNLRQEYVDLWLDDMGTGIYVSRGPASEDGNVITCTGTMDDPMSGQKDIPTRSVSTTVDKDTHKMEMFATGPDGTEFKTMEVIYTRMK